MIKKFADHFSGEADFEVISGGMVRGDRIGPATEMKDYISDAYKDVEKTTGIKFGETFLNETLNDPAVTLTSVPPAIAMCIIKEEKPDKDVDFAAAVQKAIYYDGRSPEDHDLYAEIAAEFGLNQDSFKEKMKDQKYLLLAEEDFKRAEDKGATGFPAVLIRQHGATEILAQGYMSFHELAERFKQIKQAKK